MENLLKEYPISSAEDLALPCPSRSVMRSAFRNAGQRCSALRLLCVHEAIADRVIEIIRGAASELQVGDPANLVTDSGPVLDGAALARI